MLIWFTVFPLFLYDSYGLIVQSGHSHISPARCTRCKGAGGSRAEEGLQR